MANKPILFYGLEAMAEAGIKEVGIIVGDTAGEVLAAVGRRLAAGASRSPTSPRRRRSAWPTAC